MTRDFCILECCGKEVWVFLSHLFFFFKEAELNFECSFFITLFIIKVSDMFCYCCLILSSALNHNIGVYICCLL